PAAGSGMLVDMTIPDTETLADVQTLPDNRKKKWSDFSPQQQRLIIVAAVAEFIVTSIALRDLVRRPSHLVRGWKLLWFFSFFVQPIGAPLYLIAGRRKKVESV